MSRFDHLNLPYPEMAEYLDWCVDAMGNSRATVEGKLEACQRFCMYMNGVHRIDRVNNIRSEHMKLYVESILANDPAQNYARLLLAPIFHFWRWSIAKQYHEPEEIPDIHLNDTIARCKASRPKSILSPESIFKLRTAGVGTILHATFFETLLCTGMRLGEIQQLRASNISWGKIPTDKELQLPSPYVCATVRLAPEQHLIKKRRNRKFYLSKIAGRLIKRWCEIRKIPLESNLPIFPVRRETVKIFFDSMSRRGNIHLTTIDAVQQSPYTMDEFYGMDDIDLAGVEDATLRQMVVNARLREQRVAKHLNMKASGGNKKVVKCDPAKNIHPHLLRYTNICYMFYRAFTGERNHERAAMLTSGHASAKVFYEYLVENDIIKNDLIWKTLWLGKPDHWAHLETHTTAREIARGVDRRNTSYWGTKWGGEPTTIKERLKLANAAKRQEAQRLKEQKAAIKISPEQMKQEIDKQLQDMQIQFPQENQ